MRKNVKVFPDKKGYTPFVPNFSNAAGTHLSPRIGLSRAITEAIQLYPRSVNYDDWLNSGPIEHLFKKGNSVTKLSKINDYSLQDIRDNINICVDLMKEFNLEIFVVDLSWEEMVFPVVRVLAAGLQPIINRRNPRFSDRLFNVPLLLGYRNKKLTPGDIKLREFYGYN